MNESFELTINPSDNSDLYPSRVKFWPAGYHLSNTYCYCKMIRCYNPVVGQISKMPQKIHFSCFLGTKISESQAYVFNSKSAAPEPI